MAGILSVNEDELGLYLKDDRISPSDTPSSVNLHIADILGKMSYLKVLFFKWLDDFYVYFAYARLWSYRLRVMHM